MITKKPIKLIGSFAETASYKVVYPQLKSQTIRGNTKASRKLLVHVSTVSLTALVGFVKGTIDRIKKWVQESPSPTLLPPITARLRGAHGMKPTFAHNGLISNANCSKHFVENVVNITSRNPEGRRG